MATWVKEDRLTEEQPVGWGDGAWGDSSWGGSVGTVWQKTAQETDTWTKTDRAE
jgi:hypothetical protein